MTCRALYLILLCGLAAGVLSDEGLVAFRQAPDPGWGPTGVKPREVSRIYWDLLQTSEVLVRLIPAEPDGRPARVNLVFHAFFPGRETRGWNTGLPEWPKGPPARLTVTAQAFPLTFVIPELSLRLVIDGEATDLTTPGRYRNIPCLIATDGCAPDGVEADLEPALLRSMVAARVVKGEALGFPIELTQADRSALAEFAARIGLPSNAWAASEAPRDAEAHRDHRDHAFAPLRSAQQAHVAEEAEPFPQRNLDAAAEEDEASAVGDGVRKRRVDGRPRYAAADSRQHVRRRVLKTPESHAHLAAHGRQRPAAERAVHTFVVIGLARELRALDVEEQRHAGVR